MNKVKKHFYPVILPAILIGIVVVESLLLLKFVFPPPAKTVSFSASYQQEHRLGEIFPMQVKITGIKQAINTVRVDFTYDPKQLEVVGISTKDSFAGIFIQKEIDNKAGFVRFAGGLPNPGFSQNEGVFATVYLRGLRTGIATLHFLPSSMVLANDGKGSNVLISSFADASYLIEHSNILGASTSATNTQMIFYDEH
jgi:hypothetical protein